MFAASRFYILASRPVARQEDHHYEAKYVKRSSHLKLHKKKVITIPLGVTLPLTVPGVRHKADQVFFMSVLDKHHEYKGLAFCRMPWSKSNTEDLKARLLVGGAGN